MGGIIQLAAYQLLYSPGPEMQKKDMIGSGLCVLFN